MKPLFFLTALILATGIPLSVSGEDRYITLDNFPMGTRDEPLVLRTYFPDPGLGPEVLSNHSLGARARKYSPKKASDVSGFQDPIRGIPGAIGVNFGPDLSICWDATECRLLYAWRSGFLDMTNYWGKPESGRRKGFGYIPNRVGQLIYVAKGSHPLALFDVFTEDIAPVYRGYTLVDGIPEFSYSVDDIAVHVRISPGEKPLSIVKDYRIEGAKEWDYQESGYSFKKSDKKDNAFRIVIDGTPTTIGEQGEDKPTYSTDKPNKEWGEALYTNLGCLACHSLDGGRGHGPSFVGIYGADRKITGLDEPVKADDAYIAESITNPMAKVLDSYPPGYMPPYPISDNEIASLTLFIKTLANE